MPYAFLLMVILTGLHIAHIIHWKWYWIISPIWIGPALFVLAAGLAALCEALIKKY